MRSVLVLSSVTVHRKFTFLSAIFLLLSVYADKVQAKNIKEEFAMKSKQLLAGLLCLSLAASGGSILPTAVQAASTIAIDPVQFIGDYQCEVHEDHVELLNYIGTDAVVDVPLQMNGLPLTVIREHAFAGRDVTAVTLPECVSAIGEQAFYGCSLLESVNIPEGVTAIKKETFCNCLSLQDITFPSTLTVIGEHAFYHCAINSLELPEGIIELKEGAFDNCSALTEVSLPKSLTAIGDSVFMATALKNITIPENVQTIGEWALPSSLAILTINSPDTEIIVNSIPTIPQSCLIYAPANSKAEEFAKQWGFTFFTKNGTPISPPSEQIPGDVTGDFALGVDDVVMLYKYLHNTGTLTFPNNGDVNEDGVINISDLALQKKLLLKKMSYEPVQPFSAINLSKDVKAETVEGKAADDAFVLAQTAFAVNLLQETADEDNTLISPYSVMQALAMTANGARNQTLTNMETTLGTPIDELNAYLYTQRTSQPDTEKCKLSTANSIWMRDDENLYINPEFLQINANYYNADAFKAPFDASTVKDVNNWVKESTDNMIPKLLYEEPGDNVMLYLINAVAFDAKWKYPYKTLNQVCESTFTAADGTEQDAEFLCDEEYYYLSDDHAEGFLKYYADDRYAFAALLPEEGMTVTDYIQTLTPESLHETLANPERKTLYTEMPKFSYDYSIELNQPLFNMGMTDAFISEGDFSGIGNYGYGDFYISKVSHKTFIEVGEAGTKAAAVTAVEMAPDCAPGPEYKIDLNRPFVYCIVDTETTLPIFIGTVMSVS